MMLRRGCMSMAAVRWHHMSKDPVYSSLGREGPVGSAPRDFDLMKRAAARMPSMMPLAAHPRLDWAKRVTARMPYMMPLAQPRGPLVRCMDAVVPVAPHITDESLFTMLKDIIDNIPDMEAVTLKQLREQVATQAGLEPGGLDDKKDLVKTFATTIIQGDALPVFDASGARAPDDPGVLNSEVYKQALRSTQGLVLRKLPKSRFSRTSPPLNDIDKLPIRQWHGSNPVKGFVDIIKNYQGAISEEDVMRAVAEGDMEEMPDITKPPAGAFQVNHFTQSAFIQTGATWAVVKHVVFQSDGPDGKVKPTLARSYCHGEPYLIDFGTNVKNGRKAFQDIFESLGGFQVRQWELQGGARGRGAEEASGADIDAIDAGFDFIEKCWAERSLPAIGIAQMRWVSKQLVSPASPLYAQGPYRWSDKFVEKAIVKLREQGTLAKVVTGCPYTLKSLSPWFVDNVLAELVPHLHLRSLGFIGRAGCGKTPVLETVACMMSRYWKRKLGLQGEACYRLASDLDFFRGEVGTKDRPDGLDDADPRTITPAKWKAFGDVGLTEAMTRERWGASKWVRNQLRLFAFNPINIKGEPQQGGTVTHEQFMKIIEPCWHRDMDEESSLGVLKRSCMVVITKRWCYWRPSTENEVDVKRTKLEVGLGGVEGLLNPSASAVVSAWKEERSAFPEDYEEQLAFEEQWMNAAMSKGGLQIPRLSPVPAMGVAPAANAVRLPDRVVRPFQSLSSQATSADGGDEDIRPDENGHYHIPAVRAQLVRPAPIHSVASSTSTAAAGGRGHIAAAPSTPAGAPSGQDLSESIADVQAMKRMKVDAPTRAKRERKVEELKRQLAMAEVERDSAPEGVKMETEVLAHYQSLHATLSAQTQHEAIEILDSPEPSAATPRANGSGAVDVAVGVGDESSKPRDARTPDLFGSQISQPMDAEAQLTSTPPQANHDGLPHELEQLAAPCTPAGASSGQGPSAPGADVEATKRIKVDAPTRAEREHMVEELKRRLAMAEVERDSAPEGVKMEPEVLAQYQSLHAALSAQTQHEAIGVLDSPEPSAATPPANGNGAVDAAVCAGDDSSGPRDARTYDLFGSEVSQPMDVEAHGCGGLIRTIWGVAGDRTPSWSKRCFRGRRREHPLNLERYREDWHSSCTRMTRTKREVYQIILPFYAPVDLNFGCGLSPRRSGSDREDR